MAKTKTKMKTTYRYEALLDNIWEGRLWRRNEIMERADPLPQHLLEVEPKASWMKKGKSSPIPQKFKQLTSRVEPEVTG